MRLQRLRLLLLPIVLLVTVMLSPMASASAQLPGQPRAQPIARLRTGIPGFPDPIALDTVAQYREFKAPMGAVFTATLAAYKALDIPITVRDSAHGTVGNLSWIKMRQLAGKTMSTSFNCGSGMTGPNADAYRLTIATVVLIEGLPNGGSKVGIAFVAGAQDVQGAAKDPVPCGTNGYVESQLEQLIRSKLVP